MKLSLSIPGINAWIDQRHTLTLEYILTGHSKVAPWTVEDSLTHAKVSFIVYMVSSALFSFMLYSRRFSRLLPS